MMFGQLRFYQYQITETQGNAVAVRVERMGFKGEKSLYQGRWECCLQKDKVQIQNLKSFFLMQAQLTEFLLRLTFAPLAIPPIPISPPLLHNQQNAATSQQLLARIHLTLNCESNYKTPGTHKSSFYSEQSTAQSPMKCNCKKSKCLKLYCECFSKGSFCKDCSCEGCFNTEQFSEVRARAIDEMMVKTPLPFGYRALALKGCNCRKTGCQKKYCQCYNLGLSCGQYCKCLNCENSTCP